MVKKLTREKKVNEELKFDPELGEKGLSLIMQNMDKEEYLSCAYGFHKAKSESRLNWLVASVLLNVLLISIFLCSISVAFQILS